MRLDMISKLRLRPSTLALLGAAVLAALFVLVASFRQLQPIAAGIGMGIVYLGAVAVVFGRAKVDRVAIGVVLAGIVLYMLYLGYTSYAERNYDGPEQLQYIQHILSTGRRPPASQCLICHHPPLYFYLGAGAYWLFEKVGGMGPPTFGLQILSLVFFTVFLYYAALTIQRFVKSPWLVRLAMALVVFWPYSIQMSVRVHNDALSGTLMMGAIYYAIRFYDEGKDRHFAATAVWIGLGVLTKSSIYAIAGMFIVLALYRLVRTPRRLRQAGRLIAGIAFIGITALTAKIGQEKPDTKLDLCHKVLGNACNIGKHEWVGNDVYNYVYVDPVTFLREPYLIASRDGSGRELFWSDFAKTSLFATNNTTADRETAYAFNRQVAALMIALFAAMSLGLVASVLTMDKATAKRLSVVLLSVGTLLGFMMAFRWMIPAPHHTDFRHVLVILVPISILYVDALGRARGRGLAAEWAGTGLAVTFLALSVFYFLPKRSLIMRYTQKNIDVELAKVSRPVPEETAWDDTRNLLFEENETLVIKPKVLTKVSEIEVTVDNNDRYEVVLWSGDTSKSIAFGPATNKHKGMTLYTLPVSPPMDAVREVRLRAVSGDQAYSLGHLILR